MKCADLTAEEAQHVRAALRFLRTRCGTWATLAKVLGFAVVMDAALVGMSVSVSAHRSGEGPPLAFLVTSAVVTAAVLALLLRHVHQSGQGTGRE